MSDLRPNILGSVNRNDRFVAVTELWLIRPPPLRADAFTSNKMASLVVPHAGHTPDSPSTPPHLGQ
jgi:hypothetical protein